MSSRRANVPHRRHGASRAASLRVWAAPLRALIGSHRPAAAPEKRWAAPLTEFGRADLIWAGVAGLASAALFATSLTGYGRGRDG